MFSGIWLPLLTPFRSQQPDLIALRALVEAHVDTGIAGFVALGTTAETALLSDVERAAVLDTIVDAVSDRRPIMVGLGGMDTRAFVRDVDRLEAWNVTAYLVPPPAYLCPDQDGLLWHFGQIAERTRRPIVLYNVPHRTGVSIEPVTVQRLTAYANVAGIKECVPRYFDALRETSVEMLCGTDEAFLSCLTSGGAGGVLASAHVCADLLLETQRLVESQNVAEATALFDALRPVLRLMFSAPNPSAIKAMLSFDSITTCEVRLPITQASPALVDQLCAARDVLSDLRNRWLKVPAVAG